MDPLAFSPDSTLLAAAYPRDGGQIFVRLTDSGQIFGIAHAPSRATALCFDPTGHHLVSGHVDGTVRFWRFPGLQAAGMMQINDTEVFSMDLSADGLLATSAPNGDVSLRDLTGNPPVELRSGGTETAGDWVRFLPDGRTLLTAGRKSHRRLAIWDVASGQILKQIEALAPFGIAARAGWVAAPALDPKNRQPLRSINLWSTQNASLLGTLPAPPGEKLDWWLYSHLAATPDGSLIAVTTESGQLWLWNVRAAQAILAWGAADPAIFVACSPNSRYVASGSRRERLWTLDLEQGQGPRMLDRLPTGKLPPPPPDPAEVAVPPAAASPTNARPPAAVPTPTRVVVASSMPTWIEALEGALDGGQWGGWNVPEEGMLDVVFLGAQVSGSDCVCLRFSGQVSACFLGAGGIAEDWPTHMRQGQLQAFPLHRDGLTLTNPEMWRAILSQAVQVDVFCGADPRQAGFTLGARCLGMWCAPVGLVISSEAVHAYDEAGWITGEDLISRIQQGMQQDGAGPSNEQVPTPVPGGDRGLSADGAAALQQGLQYLSQNRPDQAIAVLQKLPREGPAAVTIHLALGRAYYLIENFREALGELVAVTRLAPSESPEAYELIGEIEQRRGRPGPDVARWYKAAADLYRAKGQPDAATKMQQRISDLR